MSRQRRANRPDQSPRIRLIDASTPEDGSGAVYDVEMQNVNEGDLRLRSRYLLSSFDRDRLERGKTVVIFVCAFDPIGDGDRMYVVRPTVAGSGRHFDDSTLRVFLNAKGAAGEPARESKLPALLSYIDGGGTMGDEWVEGIDDEVRVLNADRGWRNTMLTWDSIYHEDLERESKVLAAKLAVGMAKEMAEEMAKAKAEEMAKTKAEELAKTKAEEMAEEMAKAKAEELAEQKAEQKAAKLVEDNRRLAQALVDAGRPAELADAMLDADVRSRLLEEFGIAGK